MVSEYYWYPGSPQAISMIISSSPCIILMYFINIQIIFKVCNTENPWRRFLKDAIISIIAVLKMIKRIDKSLKSSHLFLGFPSFLHNSAPNPYLGRCLEDGGRDWLHFPRAYDTRHWSFPNINMLIRTTTLQSRYHYHLHVRHEEVKPRNPASGQRWDLNPGNLSHSARFSEILVYFNNLECAFYSPLPPQEQWISFPMSPSGERFHLFLLHVSFPQLPCR